MDPLSGMWCQVRLDREVKLSDKQACIDWCQRVGIIPRTVECRRHRKPYSLVVHSNSVLGYVWHCSKCKTRRSIGNGTPFEEGHIEIERALMIGMCFAEDRSYEETVRACSYDGQVTSSTTIASWFGYYRSLTAIWADQYQNPASKIGGPGRIVQIDEALIGRRKYNRGRIVEGTWVLGMIDQDGELRLEICPGNSRTREVLTPLIQQHVEVGTEIHTDEWRAYHDLVNHGYVHKTVCHKREFIAQDGTHTQRIESNWRALRRSFTSGEIRTESIDDHLIEYLWRRWCKRNSLDTFSELVKLIKFE